MNQNGEKSRRAQSLMQKRKHPRSRDGKVHRIRGVARPRDKSTWLELCWAEEGTYLSHLSHDDT